MKKKRIEKIIDVILTSNIVLLLFIAPIKFGLPTIYSYKAFLPESFFDWLYATWPNELFVILCINCAVFFLLKLALSEGMVFKYNIITKLLGVFICICAIGLMYAVNTQMAVKTAMNIIGAACFYIIVNNSADKKNLFLIVFLSAAILVSVYGIYQRVFGFQETKEWADLYMKSHASFERIQGKLSSGRVFSTFVYPNAFAGYLLMVIPVSVLLFIQRFKKSSERENSVKYALLVSLICAAVCIPFLEGFGGILKIAGVEVATGVLILIYPIVQFVNLILTQSQGGYVVFILVILFSVYLFNKRMCLKLSLLILSVLVLSCFILLMVKRAEFFQYVKVLSLKARMEYLWSTLVMIIHKPFIGYGPGSYGSVYAQYKMLAAEETQFAHNNYLQVWAESGIGGCIVFVSIWILGLREGLRHFKENGLASHNDIIRFGAFLGLTGFVLHSCIDFDFYIPALALSAFFLLAILTDNMASTTVKKITGDRIKKILISCAVVLFILGNGYCIRLIVADTLFNKGLACYNKREYVRAIDILKSTKKWNSSDDLAQYYAGMACLSLGKPEDAVHYFNRAIELNTCSSKYYYKRAESYFQMGSFRANVEKDLKKAVKYYPTSMFYRIELAKFYEIIGQKKKALIEYQYILE